MNIIDGLECAEGGTLKKDEMKNFEFFECDDCGRICRMPMEQYKTYSEETILNATYKCKKCTVSKKDLFIKLRNEGKTIREVRQIFNVDHNKLYKMINDWGLSGWKPNKPEEPKRKEPATKPEPLDHLREVKEMVTDDQVTEVSEMVEEVVNQSLTTETVKPTVNQPLTVDTVNHPAHYTSGSIECIDAIEASVEGLDPQEAVCVGNVIKYVWRFKRKNGKQDLLKAQWYLERLINKQED